METSRYAAVPAASTARRCPALPLCRRRPVAGHDGPTTTGRPTGSVTDGVTATVDVTATVNVNVRKKGTAP